MQNAIEIKGLTKFYRGKFFRLSVNPSLDNLNLNIPQGCVFGFLGHNGAGKTTAIKCLMDLIKPTKGSVTIFDLPVDSKEARKKIGYLPDAPSFSSHLSPNQFLKTCAKLVGLDWQLRKQRIEEVLTDVGMLEYASNNMGSFSRGMMQRIGIAQALLNKPELLILDEPLVGLDPQGRRDLLTIVQKQKELGTTVFFCSHILSDVEKLCDSVGILSKGKLLFAGALNQLTSSDGIVVKFPAEHLAIAQSFMMQADSSKKIDDGGVALEFITNNNWQLIKRASLPSNVIIEAHHGTLEEEFFKLTGEDTPGNT